MEELIEIELKAMPLRVNQRVKTNNFGPHSKWSNLEGYVINHTQYHKKNEYNIQLDDGTTAMFDQSELEKVL